MVFREKRQSYPTSWQMVLGWLTTHRLIIQQETHNPRLNIVERQDPEMYLLRDFEKAEIKGETLTAQFKGGQKATSVFSFIRPHCFKRLKTTLRKQQSTAGNNALKHIHQRLKSLNGKTPSEACGIQIEGKNKWKTLIQNASKTKN
jgi:hypothetical protein